MRHVRILRVCFVSLSWLFGLTCLICLCAGPSLSPAGNLTDEPPPGPSGAILDALGSTTRAESFLLAPELNFLHRGAPRIHSWPIVARGSDLDSTQIGSLITILGKAAPDRDHVPPDHCGFDPSFGLRFHGNGDPIDLLISSDYSRWCLLRGESREGVYCPDPPALRDSLEVLIGELFPNLRGDGGGQ